MGKTNTRVDILSRKDQIDITDDKDIKMLKNELQTRQVSIKAEVIVLRRNQVVKKTILLDKIRRNQTRKQKVQKELEKYNGQAQENNGIVYVERMIYFLNNWKIQEQIL